MHNAVLSKNIDHKLVQCLACDWKCKIAPGQLGLCGVRKNINGQLKLLVWNRAAGIAIDPVEKKPLYHFLPASPILSVGTYGCNLGCHFCQNYFESQKSKEAGVKIEKMGEKITPRELVDYCLKNKIPAIAFTYNEPTIFTEWTVAIMKIAKKYGIKGVFVSNGFMSSETLDYLGDYIDAFNIDLKSFSDDFYHRLCHARLAPVLQNIAKIYRQKKWLEITTLIIPQENDSPKEITQIAKFIYQLSPEIPWHLSAFYPAYKMLDYPPTPSTTMEMAYKIGQKVGLKYLYLYQASPDKKEIGDTFCPHCGALLIRRHLFSVLENNLIEGHCPRCAEAIKGIWE